MFIWTLDGMLESLTLELAEKIHASAKEMDPLWEVYESDDERWGEFDWRRGSPDEYVKVIWVCFGGIVVHYWLKPKHDEVCTDGRLLLHVYAYTPENKLIYAATNPFYNDYDGLLLLEPWTRLGKMETRHSYFRVPNYFGYRPCPRRWCREFNRHTRKVPLRYQRQILCDEACFYRSAVMWTQRSA